MTSGPVPIYPINALRRDGSSQNGRFPQALDPEFFKVDERRLEDLLDFIFRMSKEISYVNFEGQVSGNWENFFQHDPSIILAKVLRYPLTDWKAGFSNAILDFRLALSKLRNTETPLTEGEKESLVQQVVAIVEGLNAYIQGIESPSQSIYNWARQLAKFPTLQLDFQNALVGQIKRQMQDLIRLRFEMNLELAPWKVEDFSFSTFEGLKDDPWDLQTLTPKLNPALPNWAAYLVKGNSNFEKLENIVAALNRIAASFAQSIAQLQVRSKLLFEKSLTETAFHSPHNGLLIAFLQLFKEAQGRLNEVGPQQLDYFYTKILGFAPKPSEPEKLHMIAELSVDKDKLQLPMGTAWEAPDKRVFKTRQNWNLNKASIAALRLEKTAQFELLANSTIVEKGSPATADFTKLDNGKIAWAIASPMLRMKEGQREIWISFGFESISSQFSSLNDAEKKVIKGLFSDNCKVSFTGAKTWFEIAPDDVDLRPRGSKKDHLPAGLQDLDVLLFKLIVPSNEPAIVNFDQKLHAGEFEVDAPIAQFLIADTQTAIKDVRAFLSSRKLVAVGIDLTVSGMQNMPLENQDGDLIGSAPFTPFGQAPINGNKFYVDAEEALSKKASSVELDWNWIGIPDVPLSYYFAPYCAYFKAKKAIEISSENSDYQFQGELFWGNGVATVTGNRPLFTPNDPSKGSAKFTILESAFGSENQPDFGKRITPMRNESAGAFLVLNLISPEIGFGHSLYPNLFISATLAFSNQENLSLGSYDWNYLQLPYVASSGNSSNSASGGGSYFHNSYGSINLDGPVVNTNTPNFNLVDDRDLITYSGRGPSEISKVPGWSLPSAPFTPMIVALKLKYSAQQEINLTQLDQKNAVWQISHNGLNRLKNDEKEAKLIQAYNNGGNIYFGLQDFAGPSQINLLVELESGSGDTVKELPALSWSILSGNNWKKIENSQIAGDSTKGFSESGIFTLNLPEVDIAQQTAMPKELVWLRLEMEGEVAALDRIIGMYLNGFELLESAGNEDVALNASKLNANSLKMPLAYVDGLKKCQQPYASFGGSVKEDTVKFHSRVAERLRHKNRSISFWDYEKLILERYPEVFKVKCINHTEPMEDGADLEISPGHITIVCIPKTPNFKAPNPLEPNCRRDLLRGIQSDLQKQVPPFVKIHVVSPIYEQIEVTCDIGLNPAFEPGKAIERLNEAIAKFLCPWAFDEAEEIHFGGRVHQSQLLYLLEQQEEVDVIANFELSAKNLELNAEGYLEAKQSRMVLVSELRHKITLVAKEELKSEGSSRYGGINFWRVKQTFEVNGN